MSALSRFVPKQLGEPPIAHACGSSEEDSNVADRSTVGIPMVGDPVFPESGAQALMIRRACQYAAEMARRSGFLDGDLSRFDARLEGQGTVVFIAADATQREVARFVIPERVLRFDPFKPPLRLADDRRACAAPGSQEGPA